MKRLIMGLLALSVFAGGLSGINWAYDPPGRIPSEDEPPEGGGGGNPPPTGPTASFTFSASNLVVFFNSTATPGSSPIVSWAWNFGDGQNGSGTATSHTYATPGNYTVYHTVTDQNGLFHTTPGQVTVVQIQGATIVPASSKTRYNLLGGTLSGVTWSISQGSIVSGQGTSSIEVVWNVGPFEGLVATTLTGPGMPSSTFNVKGAQFVVTEAHPDGSVFDSGQYSLFKEQVGMGGVAFLNTALVGTLSLQTVLPATRITVVPSPGMNDADLGQFTVSFIQNMHNYTFWRGSYPSSPSLLRAYSLTLNSYFEGTGPFLDVFAGHESGRPFYTTTPAERYTPSTSALVKLSLGTVDSPVKGVPIFNNLLLTGQAAQILDLGKIEQQFRTWVAVRYQDPTQPTGFGFHSVSLGQWRTVLYVKIKRDQNGIPLTDPQGNLVVDESTSTLQVIRDTTWQAPAGQVPILDGMLSNEILGSGVDFRP